MSDWSRQFDVPHSLATHRTSGNFHPALVTNDPLVTRIFVLPAVALVVARRAKNRFTEQAIFFWAQTAIVDRLRLENFPVGPASDGFWRGQTDTQCGETFGFH